MRSFRASAPEARVHHAHFVSRPYRQFFCDLVLRADAPAALRTALEPHIHAADFMARCLRKPERSLCVVCGFREPMDHAVSSFFQNLPRLLPGLDPSAPDADEIVRRELDALFSAALECEDRNTFAAYYAHWLLIGSSLFWFDIEFWHAYRLDVYRRRFRGRDLLDFVHRGIRFVLYRFERFGELREEIVQRVTGRTPVEVDANVTADKPHGAIYANVKANYRPPRSVSKLFERADFTRHFYGSVLDLRGYSIPKVPSVPLVHGGPS